MGTRSGDVDPAVVFHLHRVAGCRSTRSTTCSTSAAACSGWPATTTCARCCAAARPATRRPTLAFDVYCRRIKEYVGRLLRACSAGSTRSPSPPAWARTPRRYGRPRWPAWTALGIDSRPGPQRRAERANGSSRPTAPGGGLCGADRRGAGDRHPDPRRRTRPRRHPRTLTRRSPAAAPPPRSRPPPRLPRRPRLPSRPTEIAFSRTNAQPTAQSPAHRDRPRAPTGDRALPENAQPTARSPPRPPGRTPRPDARRRSRSPGQTRNPPHIRPARRDHPPRRQPEIAFCRNNAQPTARSAGTARSLGHAEGSAAELWPIGGVVQDDFAEDGAGVQALEGGARLGEAEGRVDDRPDAPLHQEFEELGQLRRRTHRCS